MALRSHKFHQEKVEVLHTETASILQQVLNLLLLLFQAEQPFLQDHDQEEGNWEAVVISIDWYVRLVERLDHFLQLPPRSIEIQKDRLSFVKWHPTVICIIQLFICDLS